MERNYAAELQEAQAKINAVRTKRDRMNRIAGGNEQKVTECYAQLKAHGVVNDASKRLTVDELKKLSEASKRALDAALSEVQTHLTAGEALVAEYEATETATT